MDRLARRQPSHSLILYTRSVCHLCDEAKQILLHNLPASSTIQEVDVDDHPELASRFGECVPVVEVDGKVRFRGRVNPVLLRRLLRR